MGKSIRPDEAIGDAKDLLRVVLALLDQQQQFHAACHVSTAIDILTPFKKSRLDGMIESDTAVTTANSATISITWGTLVDNNQAAHINSPATND